MSASNVRVVSTNGLGNPFAAMFSSLLGGGSSGGNFMSNLFSAEGSEEEIRHTQELLAMQETAEASSRATVAIILSLGLLALGGTVVYFAFTKDV